MAKSTMLGTISVKDLHGPWSDFMGKLQTEDSQMWFAAFKRFLRKENPWRDMDNPCLNREVKVDCTRTPEQMIAAINRKKDLDETIVTAMPRGSVGKTTIVFFKTDRQLFYDDIEKEYTMRGLKPVDPYVLLVANEAEPELADVYPNCTHWKHTDGKWSNLAFGGSVDCRFVRVKYNSLGWVAGWWFAGVEASQ